MLVGTVSSIPQWAGGDFYWHWRAALQVVAHHDDHRADCLHLDGVFRDLALG